MLDYKDNNKYLMIYHKHSLNSQLYYHKLVKQLITLLYQNQLLQMCLMLLIFISHLYPYYQ